MTSHIFILIINDSIIMSPFSCFCCEPFMWLKNLKFLKQTSCNNGFSANFSGRHSTTKSGLVLSSLIMEEHVKSTPTSLPHCVMTACNLGACTQTKSLGSLSLYAVVNCKEHLNLTKKLTHKIVARQGSATCNLQAPSD